jgi:predicted DCC family thiol-disulfide oxidoreductase YuxK
MPRPYHIFYDGQCPLCQRTRQLLLRLPAGAPLVFVDTHEARAMASFPAMADKDIAGQVWVRNPAGKLAGGYDGLLLLAPAFSFGRLLQPLLRGALARRLGRRVYGWVSRHRYQLFGATSCAHGACLLRNSAIPASKLDPHGHER